MYSGTYDLEHHDMKILIFENARLFPVFANRVTFNFVGCREPTTLCTFVALCCCYMYYANRSEEMIKC